MAGAVELVRRWIAARPLPGLTCDVVQLPGRTPLIFVDVPATPGASARDTVLLYGHVDKQPPMVGWRDGLGPWEPVYEGGRLYGRGGGDDGYAAFAALGALEAVRAGGGECARAVVLIEASEESGSPDLPAYVDLLADRIGDPTLVVCLDSGCATYDDFWVTTSLRGIVGVALTVTILTEGVHSGAAGGIVPSSFRLLRALLSRVEDEGDGSILLPELFVPIPPEREQEAAAAAAELGASVADEYPFVPTAEPLGATPTEQLLNRTWRPALGVVGIDGAPAVAEAGNVLRPYTRVKLSFRLPPTCDADRAAAAITAALTTDPPSGAQVTCDVTDLGAGWDAPATGPWLAAALDDAGRAAFGSPARFAGEGGSIPFMGMLGARFPDAQFVVTGVMGPGSNAHGPNEFLDVPTAKRVTAAVAHVLDAHARR
jgi:acetylornithine deacetylase/succinyl-diaminopimelate desuccinylase-like protein